MSRKYFKYIPFVSFLIILTCSVSSSPPSETAAAAKETKKHWEMQFVNIKDQSISLFLEVADTQRTQARGLMFRKSLERNSGMIFVYSKPRIMRFWMKHTGIPLSIAFIDENNMIIEIHDMRPYDERIVSSSIRALYAVEANQGWFKKNYIFERSKVSIIKH